MDEVELMETTLTAYIAAYEAHATAQTAMDVIRATPAPVMQRRYTSIAAYVADKTAVAAYQASYTAAQSTLTAAQHALDTAGEALTSTFPADIAFEFGGYAIEVQTREEGGTTIAIAPIEE